MRALALVIEYDGTDYHGWQIQSTGETVQQVLEEALSDTFGVPCSVVGSGRTDAGVHARAQVAHVHLDQGAHRIPIEKVALAINTYLPDDIRILRAIEVSEDFHARFDPLWREYRYRIAKERSVFARRFAWAPEAPYNPSQLAASAEVFVGRHDFTTFSKLNPDTKSYVCNVLVCRVHANDDAYEVQIRADRFVYGMCRSIVGGMMEVARGRFTIKQVEAALQAQDRALHPALAPACGLTLHEVRYPIDL